MIKTKLRSIGSTHYLHCRSASDSDIGSRLESFGPGVKVMEAVGLLVGTLQDVLLVQSEAANFLLTVERVRWNPPGRYFLIA